MNASWIRRDDGEYMVSLVAEDGLTHFGFGQTLLLAVQDLAEEMEENLVDQPYAHLKAAV